MKSNSNPTQAIIDELQRSTGARNPEDAIRRKSAELIARYVQMFGEPEIPINVDVLASMIGITRSESPPLHSPDAELAPDGQGGMTIRINPDRPETRQRFSMAHEIAHTFFPDYDTKEWCRTDARFRNRENPDDFVEMLCDIGAAELLFPQPWFSRHASTVAGASGLVALAKSFNCSREATIRRFAETSIDSVAAVYFTWKLKPSQKETIGNKDQLNLFGQTSDEVIREARRLRIEYVVPSPTFAAAGHFFPSDKSVTEGAILKAASTGEASDDECFLDLGQSSGVYRVWAVPLWTSQEDRGSSGEYSVAAALFPVDIRKSSRKRTKNEGRTLFGDI